MEKPEICGNCKYIAPLKRGTSKMKFNRCKLTEVKTAVKSTCPRYTAK